MHGVAHQVESCVANQPVLPHQNFCPMESEDIQNVVLSLFLLLWAND